MTSPTGLSRRFVAALALSAALTPLNSTMVAVALPAIGEAIGASPGTLTAWLVTSYLIVNIVVQSPAGKLGDLIGRTRTLVLGQLVFALGAALALFLPNLAGLTASRIVMAVGGAFVVPTAMAVLRSSIAAERRARAFGYLGALLAGSAALGPIVGGVLTRHLGWIWIFAVNLPLLALALGLMLSQRRSNTVSEKREPMAVDGPGLILLALGLGLSVAGFKQTGMARPALVALGVSLTAAFVLWERRASAPLIDLGLFRRRPFVVGSGVVALQNLGMYALIFHMPFFLKRVMKLDSQQVGQTLLAMMAMMVLCSPLGGRASERLGTRTTVLVGLAASLVGIGVLLEGLPAHSLLWIAVGLGFVGCGLGFVMGPAQSAALSAVPKEQSGVAAGVMSTMRYLGGVIGVTLISVILSGHSAEALLAESRVCLAIYAGGFGLATVLAFALPGRTPSAEKVSSINGRAAG